jgi:hypothetical protein
MRQMEIAAGTLNQIMPGDRISDTCETLRFKETAILTADECSKMADSQLALEEDRTTEYILTIVGRVWGDRNS